MPRDRPERPRWRQTLFVDHLWAGLQHRGHRPRRRDPVGAERGAVCIRVRACGRHLRQRPPLQRGRGGVVRACFVAAAVFVGGRVASREGGRACSRAFSRPPLSLAAAAAPCARACCSWRPSLLCARRWYTTVLGRGCGGRRAASPLWRPLCAQAAASLSLPTRCRTVRGPAGAAAWSFPRRVRSQKRSAGAVCGSSAVCADARWASATIIPCARHPARVRRRRALGPFQRLHHEQLRARLHHLKLWTLLSSAHYLHDRRARIVKTCVPPRGGRR